MSEQLEFMARFELSLIYHMHAQSQIVVLASWTEGLYCCLLSFVLNNPGLQKFSQQYISHAKKGKALRLNLPPLSTF